MAFKCTKYIAVDTETTGLHCIDDYAFCASICNQEGNAEYIDLDTFSPLLKDILSNKDGIIPVFHNAKFDFHMLTNRGYPIPEVFEDTMCMAYMVNEYHQSISMEYLVNKYFPNREKYNDPKLKQWMHENKKDIKANGYKNVPKELIIPYAKDDVINTMLLFVAFKKFIHGWDLTKAYELEKQFTKCLYEAERTGVRINVLMCSQKSAELLKDLAKVEEFLKEGYGIKNPRSPIQIKQALLAHGIIVKSTNKESLKELESLGHNIAKTITMHRKIKDVVSRVLLPVMAGTSRKDYRIRSSLGQFFVKTGRISSRDPNLQNLKRPNPKDKLSLIPRRLVIPSSEEFEFIGADYDAEEMRIIADEANDPRLKEMFEKGIDPYVEVARICLGKEEINKAERYAAKQSLLGKSYGMGVMTFVKQARRDGMELDYGKAKHVSDTVDQLFPGVKEKLHYYSSQIRLKGYVTDRFGKRYNVPVDFCYKAFNAIVQGTGAGVMKRAWIELSRYAGMLCREYGQGYFKILLAFHDEFLCEIHKDIPTETGRCMLIDAMESCNKYFSVPLTASLKSFGRSWGEIK